MRKLEAHSVRVTGGMLDGSAESHRAFGLSGSGDTHVSAFSEHLCQRVPSFASCEPPSVPGQGQQPSAERLTSFPFVYLMILGHAHLLSYSVEWKRKNAF